MGIFDFLKSKNVAIKCPFRLNPADFLNQYWCDKVDPRNMGMLGRGMRTQITENHFKNYCEGNFKQCPLYKS